MQDDYVDVAKIPTHVMTWGKWLDEPFKPDEKEICVMITGNPGMPGFYTTFLSTIYETLGKKMPVWVVGYAGHGDPSRTNRKVVPALADNEKMFDQQGQVYHKAAFLEQFVPKGVKVHLIGYSIGSWIILELLKKPAIKERIHRGYLLFPMIERLATTPKGRMIAVFLPRFNMLRLWLVWLLSVLPRPIQIFLISIYFAIYRIPYSFIGTALNFADYSIMEKVLFLATEEMQKVVEADIATIEKNKGILKFYYGPTDGWAPMSYMHDLKARIPDINVELCSLGLAHGFALTNGPEMGYIVAEWIKNNPVA